MARIFICYRREDTAGQTGRLHDRLVMKFGRERVFRDIDTISPGKDFAQAIKEAVGSCDMLLAVIGRQWLTGADEKDLRRIDNPEDFVRQEIAEALTGQTAVIPMLVQGATMPSEDDLPMDLRSFARRNAVELSETRWDYDVDRLIKAIQKKPLLSRNVVALGSAALLGVSAMGLVMYISISHWPPVSPEERQQQEQKHRVEHANAKYPIHLRASQEARLKTQFDDLLYKIVSAELDRSNSSKLILRLVIRLTVNSWPGANFWNDSFRLLIGGVPQAPVSWLNDLVEAHSAKEGIVEFSVPSTITRATLQVRYKKEEAEIPIDLTPVQL